MDAVARTVNGQDKDEDNEEEVEEFKGDVVEKRLTKFQLATPTPMPSYLNVHFICETASRLLFLSIHWVRSVSAFAQIR